VFAGSLVKAAEMCDDGADGEGGESDELKGLTAVRCQPMILENPSSTSASCMAGRAWLAYLHVCDSRHTRARPGCMPRLHAASLRVCACTGGGLVWFGLRAKRGRCACAQVHNIVHGTVHQAAMSANLSVLHVRCGANAQGWLAPLRTFELNRV
jgi:hypothetical protein